MTAAELALIHEALTHSTPYRSPEAAKRRLDALAIVTRAQTASVHVEDLFNHVNAFTANVLNAISNREYSKVVAERTAFNAWCEEVGLPIDFTETEG